MKRDFGRISGVVVVCAFAANAVAGEVTLTEGTNGALSPDRTCLAFQRDAGDETWLGVMDLKDGRIDWIEKGPGRSAFPSWTRSGALLYAHGDILHSAYANWQLGGSEGYGIRIRENGTSRDLLPRGRWFDYSPLLAGDGQTLWFCSSRPDPKEAHQIHSSVCRVRLDRTNAVEVLYTPRIGHPCGVSQPVVSPDGRQVVWGELQDVHSTWCLMAARADDFSRCAVLTPPEMAAYAPNFSPDGSLIVFTGYREADPGWCVYVLDPARGAAKRLCRGENASFASDGQGLIYDFEGKIRRRAFTAADRPGTADIWPKAAYRERWCVEEEKILWHWDGPSNGKRPLPAEAAFGNTRTLFIRMTLTWDGKSGKAISLVTLYYKDAGLYLSNRGNACMLTADEKGCVSLWIGNAIRWGQFVRSRSALRPGQEQTVTAIVSDGAIWMSLNGEPPERMVLAAGQVRLDEPVGAEAYQPAGVKTKRSEVGAGWPANVPQPRLFGAYGWEDVK